MSEEKQEIAYINYSTKRIVWGYSDIHHTLSKGISDADGEGYVTHYEYINGKPRQIKINLKGQLKLDHANRGGKRLWQRIYDKNVAVKAMQDMGVDMGVEDIEPKAPVVTEPERELSSAAPKPSPKKSKKKKKEKAEEASGEATDKAELEAAFS